MWLPKDERLILAGLSHTIEDGDGAFYISDLTRFLSAGYATIKIPETSELNAGVDDSEVADNVAWHKAYATNHKRVEAATRDLAERGLITLQSHQHDLSVQIVGPTLAGRDLGRKYSNWLTRSGLWFQEYNKHWLWVIIAFVGGVVLTCAINKVFNGSGK
jgi:hypothetical protein